MSTEISCAFKVNDKKCSILTVKKCLRCSFRLTAEELTEKRERADERLSKRLSAQQRADIKAKYGEREGKGKAENILDKSAKNNVEKIFEKI